MRQNAAMDLEAFRWLLTDAGQRLLARAEDAPDDPLEASALLRREATAGQVAAALTQATLRRRAVPKFGELAARMYFTPEGLEQATRLAVAEHRAARLGAARAESAWNPACDGPCRSRAAPGDDTVAASGQHIPGRPCRPAVGLTRPHAG